MEFERETIQAATDNQYRQNDLYTVDLIIKKEFAATGDTSPTFSIDGVNVFNAGAVLRRELNLSRARSDYVDETLSPRIVRRGVRLNWR